ncbi:uncharacterized protein LOC133816630 [Humulus lupulus]|uniref:uncharacterized protein LOC133816630 n=1 Tax=Humulus lupulus TaxID=3486 RepID=UPI002B40113C|nr:uncharacterized protein LOC133816630 [Humulus lupulus]
MGRLKYAIVAIDYYTKWVEAESMSTITSKKALDFDINNIVCQYGLPHKIMSDNRKQFDSIHFIDFFERHAIVKSFSAVARPQANGKMDAMSNILNTKEKAKSLKEQVARRVAPLLMGIPDHRNNFNWTYSLLDGLRM